MEGVGHGPLEGSPNNFEVERHFFVCKHMPGENICCLMLVLKTNYYLIISRESIHEGKYFISSTLINDMIDNRVGKLSLGQVLFKSLKSIRTWIVPCFLSRRIGFETNLVKGTR